MQIPTVQGWILYQVRIQYISHICFRDKGSHHQIYTTARCTPPRQYEEGVVSVCVSAVKAWVPIFSFKVNWLLLTCIKLWCIFTQGFDGITNVLLRNIVEDLGLTGIITPNQARKKWNYLWSKYIVSHWMQLPCPVLSYREYIIQVQLSGSTLQIFITYSLPFKVVVVIEQYFVIRFCLFPYFSVGPQSSWCEWVHKAVMAFLQHHAGCGGCPSPLSSPNQKRYCAHTHVQAVHNTYISCHFFYICLVHQVDLLREYSAHVVKYTWNGPI